jgi:hypothetical protein
MGGESEVLVAIFHFVQWLFTAPYAEIRPYVDRIIYLTGCEFCNWPQPFVVSEVMRFPRSHHHSFHKAIA